MDDYYKELRKELSRLNELQDSKMNELKRFKELGVTEIHDLRNSITEIYGKIMGLHFAIGKYLDYLRHGK